MKSIITRSLLYVLISFLLLFIIYYLNYDSITYSRLLNTIKYLLHEQFGLVLFISQLLYALFYREFRSRDIIINSFICSILYILIAQLFPDYNHILVEKLNLTVLQVERANIEFVELFDTELLQVLRDKIHHWDITDYPFISSFSLLLCNMTLLFYCGLVFNNSIFIKFLIITVVFFYNLLIWNYMHNSLLVLISLLLMREGVKSENT